MANGPKDNLPKISADKATFPKGGSAENQYSSSKVLGKAASSTARPSQYTLENQKKGA
jgi:hypothetical protein